MHAPPPSQSTSVGAPPLSLIPYPLPQGGGGVGGGLSTPSSASSVAAPSSSSTAATPQSGDDWRTAGGAEESATHHSATAGGAAAAGGSGVPVMGVVVSSVGAGGAAGGAGGSQLLSAALPTSSSSSSSASVSSAVSAGRPSSGSASRAAAVLGSSSVPSTPRPLTAAPPNPAPAIVPSSTSAFLLPQPHPSHAAVTNGGSHAQQSTSPPSATGGSAQAPHAQPPSLQQQPFHGAPSGLSAAATPSSLASLPSFPASSLSSGLPGALSSSSVSMDALVDGVSDSEADSDDGAALHPMAMRMIEEEEDESIEEAASGLKLPLHMRGAGGGGGGGGGRRTRGDGGGGGRGGEMGARRGGERASDSIYDDAVDRGYGGHSFPPPAASYGGYLPGPPYGPPYPPLLYHPYPSRYPPSFRPPYGALQWSDGVSSGGAAAPASPLSPSAMSSSSPYSTSPLSSPPSSSPFPPLSGWASATSLSSSASSSLLSAPISLRGVRTFVFCVATLNCSTLLIRDASLQSFALFLLLANTVVALCVLTGRPFSLAVLLQAAAPQQQQTQRPVKALNKGGGVSGEEGVEGSDAGASLRPSASSSASSSSQWKAPLSSSVGRHPTPPKAVAGAPLSSPSSRPPAAVPAPALLPAPVPVNSSAPPLLASDTASLPVDISSPAPAVAEANGEGPPAAAAAAAGTALPSSSSATSSTSSSPIPSRSPSPVPSMPTAPPSPSPFASSSPSYDSGPWTVAPLPLFTRGFQRKIPAGVSTRYSEKPELATWCRTAGESFMVRMGPNYRRTKAKSASAPSLYECVGLDIFQTDAKVDHIARLLRLPLPPARLRRRGEASAGAKEEKRRKASAALAQAAAAYAAHLAGASDPSAGVASFPPLDPVTAALLVEYPDGDFTDASDELDGEFVPTSDDAAIGVPPLWVVNFQIPAYDPPMPMWGKKEEGEGYSVVLYYSLTEQAKDDLRQNLTPAARLLKAFVANVGDERMHSRYKSIPKILNPDDCEVGRTTRSLITSYNAKPFLTGPWCHAFIKGPGYVEVDIDVHRFRYVARKGAHSFLESLKSMVIDIAFVVEGQDDEELPEQVQGATRIHFPSPQDAKNITHYLRLANKTNA